VKAAAMQKGEGFGDDELGEKVLISPERDN
jgi:hypothetical protein